LKDLRALQFTEELSRQTADPVLASQPFAAGRDGLAATEGADVLILESLEHAEERNAEILAELVVYETSGDAILMQPAENGDGGYGLTITGLKDADLTPDDIATQMRSARLRRA
jgi:3-oxoacyl-[acyl-carrier-protein] synthase II